MAVLTPLMRGSALTDCFTDECLLQGMLDFEAATALAQAHCGVIPPSAVAAISAACRAENIDVQALGGCGAGGESGYPTGEAINRAGEEK